MPAQRSMRFPADLAYVASVRDVAAEAADDLRATVDRNDLALIVGELAANAAEHQPGEAVDSAPDDPDGHRGLHLVNVISHSWGVQPEGTGKRIWARLSPAR